MGSRGAPFSSHRGATISAKNYVVHVRCKLTLTLALKGTHYLVYVRHNLTLTLTLKLIYLAYLFGVVDREWTKNWVQTNSEHTNLLVGSIIITKNNSICFWSTDGTIMCLLLEAMRNETKMGVFGHQIRHVPFFLTKYFMSNKCDTNTN